MKLVKKKLMYMLNVHVQSSKHSPAGFICNLHLNLCPSACVQTGHILWCVTDVWRHTPYSWDKSEIYMITLNR